MKQKWNSLSPRIQSFLLALPVVIGMIAYYSQRWGSVAEFSLSVDHHAQLFFDYIGHYYPMGRQILEDPKPYPGFFYSAFFALLMVPFGWFEKDGAMIAWGVSQVVALVALCIIPLRGLLKLTPVVTALYVLVCLASFPMLHNFKWGQVSVLVTVGIIGAFQASDSKRPILAGIVLAVVACIKYYPAVFIVYFAIKKCWKTCISFAVAGSVFYVAVPAIILGPGNYLAFEEARLASVSGAEWMSFDPNSHYLPNVVSRWIGLYRGTGPATDPMLLQYGPVCAGCVFVLNVGLVWFGHLKNVSGHLLLSLMLLFVSLPLIVKTSWPHYFVFLPFCQLGLMKVLLSGGGGLAWLRIALLVLPVSSIVLSCVFYFSTYDHWLIYSGYGIVSAANLLVMFGVVMSMLLKGFKKC